MLALPLRPTASGSSSWRRREAAIGWEPLGQDYFLGLLIYFLIRRTSRRSIWERRMTSSSGSGRRSMGLRLYQRHRFSSKGYCVWPPAEVHMATCRELPDWPDHESSEIALSGYSAVYWERDGESISPRTTGDLRHRPEVHLGPVSVRLLARNFSTRIEICRPAYERKRGEIIDYSIS